MERNPGGPTRIAQQPLGREVRSVRRAKLTVLVGPDRGKEIELGERSSAVIGTDPDVDLVLADDTVSRRHAELRAEPEGYVLRDLGSTNGVRLGEMLVREVLLVGESSVISLGDTDIRFTLCADEVRSELSNRDRFGLLLGSSPAMRQMFALLERAAASDSTVLVEGESGTGKEVVAESLHRNSRRAEAPFVVVDCSAIPPNLIESELFGHEKGLFTGATNMRAGAIEEASTGTLFLDEIGELPLDLQPKFLRALERRQVKRVGSTQYRDVDVRVIAATNRDLAKCVAAGTFRADLYYRLAVVKVAVPPLRHHVEDIPVLARHFVSEINRVENATAILTSGVLAAFASYSWPGNVRELRNVVERMLALGDFASALGSEALPLTPAQPSAPNGAYHQERRSALDRFEREYCRAVLQQASGVVLHAAERAGISRQMFHRLLRKHGIDGE